MTFANTASDNNPISDLNTTPLIDVLLVLLVMFIITIPVATHTVDIDLPGPGEIIDGPIPDAIKNKITIDANDRILWNGTKVTEAQTAALLAETKVMQVEPELQYEPTSHASYQAAARTLRIIEASGVGKFGFVGNEKYRQLNQENPT